MTEPMPAELQQAIQLLFADMTFKASGPSFYRLGMVDIKKEYRKKALLLHPDRSELLGESRSLLEEKFKKINHAYGILKSEFQDKYFILRVKSVPRPVRARQPETPARVTRNGFSWREAPAQRGKEFFYIGSSLPKRSLRLGEYLFCRQLISWETLIKAYPWEDSSSIPGSSRKLNLSAMSRKTVCTIFVTTRACMGNNSRESSLFF